MLKGVREDLPDDGLKVTRRGRSGSDFKFQPRERPAGYRHISLLPKVVSIRDQEDGNLTWAKLLSLFI